MKRREFIRATGVGAAAAYVTPASVINPIANHYIRLGGPLFEPHQEPESWISALKKAGYRAAYCPVGPDAGTELVRAYENAAREHEIVISEVGAWSNPISPDAEQAREAQERCIKGLDLADRIGARCCVNISGSRNEKYWAGPHRDNLTADTFDLVVEVTRKIIDAVKPTRSFFALEAMPWSFPDSADTYLDLLEAVDRDHFGVHLDPVNMITSPRDYFNNGILIREMFAKLGPRIRSCHAKDITLREDNYIPQLDEIRPGLGSLDYGIFLQELSRLKDVPLMMEHLETAGEYAMAAEYIRSVGRAGGIDF